MAHLIVDIDGTIADCRHRLHLIQTTPKNWQAFYDAAKDDAPIHPIIFVVRDICNGVFHGVLYVTGRPERIREPTVEWLRKHFLPNPLHKHNGLYMRADNDFRPDHEVKREILHRLRAEGLDPTMAIEDRSQVVKMWREEGLTCLQVAEGDY